jgi:hypothetical protein
MHKVVLLAKLVKTAFAVYRYYRCFLAFLCFSFKNQRLKRCTIRCTIDFDKKNSLLLCNGTVRAHNTFPCLKMEKMHFWYATVHAKLRF